MPQRDTVNRRFVLAQRPRGRPTPQDFRLEEAAIAVPKEGEVVLRTQWGEASKRVRLIVQDSGPGFPGHILKRAFEPYVTTKAKGTGLGLAVVKKIADEHAARIDLKNRVQNGVVQGAQVSLSFGVAS